jgi:hypothetical protein
MPLKNMEWQSKIQYLISLPGLECWILNPFPLAIFMIEIMIMEGGSWFFRSWKGLYARLRALSAEDKK